MNAVRLAATQIAGVNNLPADSVPRGNAAVTPGYRG